MVVGHDSAVARKLDQTKILELNSFLGTDKPDILILNETWFKSSIKDGEIIEGTDYKIERRDRSSKSHPPDPNDPKKFRANGGGVLIAVRNDLELSSSRINLSCAAELLGITLTLKNNKKIAICTCYRVGTLGKRNHEEVHEYLHKIRARKNIKKKYCLAAGGLGATHI